MNTNFLEDKNDSFRFNPPPCEYMPCRVYREGDEPDWDINPKLYSAVYDDMPENLSLEEKAVYIYMKLCKILRYDPGYDFYDKIKDDRYQDYFSKEKLESIVPDSEIICYDFARIFDKFINTIDGDIHSVIIDITGHFLNGIYTNNVSVTFDSIIGARFGIKYGNDFTKAKNGIELTGINIYSDEQRYNRKGD